MIFVFLILIYLKELRLISNSSFNVLFLIAVSQQILEKVVVIFLLVREKISHSECFKKTKVVN